MSETTAARIPPGTVLAERFRVERFLAGGGMGGRLTGDHKGCLNAEVCYPIGKRERMIHFRTLLTYYLISPTHGNLANSVPDGNFSSQSLN